MENKVLVVVDMQNDFIDGALANPLAQKIVDKVAKYISKFEGLIVFTRDTHQKDYLETREGKHLPVPHCIAMTNGWQINSKIFKAAEDNKKARVIVVNKSTFSAGTSLYVGIKTVFEYPNEIEVCGTCTDICVVSNALSLIGSFKEARISVLEKLCAGLTKEKHKAAIEVMRSCQIEVVE
jgi:nicotinamidase-related amidase